MSNMQAAFRAGMSTSVSLLHVNLMAEWCAMHGVGLVDQGHDVAKAYDSVSTEVKEMVMLRMGVGRDFAELQNELDMGDRLLVLTGFGASDEVCAEWEGMSEEERPWQGVNIGGGEGEERTVPGASVFASCVDYGGL